MFRVRAFTISLLLASLAVSCGGDGSVLSDDEGGNSDFPKVIRMIESTTNFTADDVKSIGWKADRLDIVCGKVRCRFNHSDHFREIGISTFVVRYN